MLKHQKKRGEVIAVNIKGLAGTLLLCVFLAVVTTGCGEPCAARLAWAKVEKANMEYNYAREEGIAGNLSVAEQHLENYKNYIAAARQIIQKAGSEYPELPECVRRNWSIIFQRADVRANQMTAALELAKIGAQMPVSEIMADPTTADIEDLKTLTKAVRHFYAVQSESLEKLKVLIEQQFGSVPEDQCPNLKKEIAHVEKVVIGLRSELELLENELANRGINIE
ncbi:hypothetical protein M1N52_04220 [Thermodesulfovibrionales bacterium]|nr:hypothetical protein [Thermodesulfovibrionales bacterium]